MIKINDLLCFRCNLIIFVSNARHYAHISRLSTILKKVVAGNKHGNEREWE